jgi:hypothetical protein
MQTKIWLITGVVLSLNLFGCSDPKAANDKNIKAALSDYLAGPGGALCLDLHQWPVDLAPDDLRMMARFPQGAANEMKVLQDAGLTQSQDMKLDGVDFFGHPNIGKRYTLTEAGKTYNQEKSTDQFGQNYAGGLCFAHKKLDSIISWKPLQDAGTDPSGINVTYHSTLTNVAPWVNSAGFKAAFPNVDTSTTPQSEQITLTLMDKGWWVKT